MNVIVIITLLIKELLILSHSNGEEAQVSSTLTAENYWLNPRDANISTISDAATGATSFESLECPSTNVIRVKYKCPGPSNSWSDCTRSHCCPGYNFINGKCIPAHVNPCNINLCEQRCAFILQRVVCTCWDGYRFMVNNQKRGNESMCIDIDECKEGIHDCQQICTNTPGSFVCSCNSGFILHVDNKTCVNSNEKLNHIDTKCVANCNTVLNLQKKVSKLQEKLTALETAVSLSIYSNTQFRGQTGPPGPPGPPGTRGRCVSNDFHHASAAYSDESTNNRAYSTLDSFVQTNIGYCKCQRGPIGPPGPPGATGKKGAMGERGFRGAKGATGNLDFLLLLLADVRHDITLLQERIFPGETLPKFDFESILKKQKSFLDTEKVENGHNDDTKNFQGSKTVQVLNYTPEGLVESSGDEWNHYDE